MVDQFFSLKFCVMCSRVLSLTRLLSWLLFLFLCWTFITYTLRPINSFIIKIYFNIKLRGDESSAGNIFINGQYTILSLWTSVKLFTCLSTHNTVRNFSHFVMQRINGLNTNNFTKFSYRCSRWNKSEKVRITYLALDYSNQSPIALTHARGAVNQPLCVSAIGLWQE